MDESQTPDLGEPGRFTRRNFLIGGVLAGASGIAWAREPQVANPVIDQARFESWVPDAFGPWRSAAQTGVLLPPPDTLRDRLYDILVTRVYVSPALPPVMLLLAYNNAQSGVVQVHRPEVCYPVGGFKLSATEPVEVRVGDRDIPANIFTAVGPNRTEQVEYLTRLGSAFPRSWVDQRLAVIRANLAGDIPDGMLMRVSVLELDLLQARPILADFTRQFIARSDIHLQRLLLGPDV